MRRGVDPRSLVGAVSDEDRGSRKKRSMSSEVLPSLLQGTPEPRRTRSLGRSSGKRFLARSHAHGSDSDSATSDVPRVKRGSSQPSSSRYETPMPSLPPCGSLAEVDLESGGVSDSVRSDAGRGRRSSTNSRKEKRPQRSDRRSSTRRPRSLLIGLALCTLLFGPIATLLSYMRVPAPPSSGDGPRVSTAGWRRGAHAPSLPQGPEGRVLHLSLAGSKVKARMVLPRNVDWAGFVAGTKERLQIEHVAHVTDHSGEGIHSVADLMHDDTLIVHEAHPHGAGVGADTVGSGAGTTGDGLGAGVPDSSATPLHKGPAAGAAATPSPPPPPSRPPECGGRHPTLRIAMLIPLLGSPPDFLPYFLASARSSAPLVDFFLFHEGATIPWDRPPNVKLVDVGRGGLSELVGLKLGEELALPLRNATVVLRSLKLLFERWPRLVAEYKPAYGRFFAEYISGYSHWGYCDLDMVVGHVPFFFDMAELTEQDIVSFSYGDAGGLYLRGQWTVHRNDPTVNGVWRSCANLGAGLEKELQLKMAYLRSSSQADGVAPAGRQHTRFVSAEGCYSKHAVAAGLRIKIAPKQAIGLRVPSGSHALAAGGAVWHCSSGREPDEALVRELLAASAGQRCYASLPAAQPATGDEVPVSVRDSGCGDWISTECRMCNAAPSAIAADAGSIAYYARGGRFYGRRVDTSAMALPSPNLAGCKQAAIFHFQEWKKVWDANPGHVAVEPMGSHDTVDPNLAFSISTNGIRRIRV